ncbi:MAG: carotenoid 1,2-hydratase, partial [Gemmatimonadetes bacterium]|nr:carotenoid 1,2-hydratase [Gemmatimonadota bacterium]NIQ54295.1 carotenoid 1,2-hydratase [Gemmatimonadota bacterium]NIU74505.1 carotenoid 1,2-hydratase [Gammaproteobacteria bacterium]NIX44458.1 carotenoid 1,2-hydratase [Gemmatimonadota bacterium]NIY08686.1 carotenoid 1,2-hydratase [Gemmatimonadota bacterium]
ASPWATRQAYMGHFALTDVAGETFHAFERFERGALGLAGAEAEPLRIWIGDWEVGTAAPGGTVTAGSGPDTVPGTVFRLEAAEGPVALDLRLAPSKPVVLQGVDGLSAKGPEPGNASYYYSLTRLGAAGTVTVDGVGHRVRGLAWLDREWSTSALSPGLVGWDWFALQLDDGSDLMVYRLRREDGGTAPYSAGTFVAADGAVTQLDAGDWALEATGSWESPRGERYPSGWRLRVPELGLALTVDPRLRDQELDLAFRYWEGAVTVTGRRQGD